MIVQLNYLKNKMKTTDTEQQNDRNKKNFHINNVSGLIYK